MHWNKIHRSICSIRCSMGGYYGPRTRFIQPKPPQRRTFHCGFFPKKSITKHSDHHLIPTTTNKKTQTVPVGWFHSSCRLRNRTSPSWKSFPHNHRTKTTNIQNRRFVSNKKDVKNQPPELLQAETPTFVRVEDDGRVFKPSTTSNTIIIMGVVVVMTTMLGSYQVRRVRNRWIEDLLPVWGIDDDDDDDDDDDAHQDDNDDDDKQKSPSVSSWNTEYPNRSRDSILSTIERAGLMGQKHVSVKEELDHIRKWHIDHGFKGGLVIRDLTKPLFQWKDDNDHENDDDNHDDETDPKEQHAEVWKLDLQTFGRFVEDPMRLARRECYYLYYELEPDGRITQQIFCRGTTLALDVLTCLQAIMEYDDDLGCAVHKGFRDQANRVLEDVLPLLPPPNDRRAVIEVCGHSLGGAVATILAVKLLKRGYKVTRITTVGEPAYVKSRKDATELEKLLPKDHIRIEDDWDFVPFLPPFGSHAGNKIWLLHKAGGGKARFVKDQPWTDSFWLNFCLPEILMAHGKPHRIPNYIQRLSASQRKDNND